MKYEFDYLKRGVNVEDFRKYLKEHACPEDVYDKCEKDLADFVEWYKAEHHIEFVVGEANINTFPDYIKSLPFNSSLNDFVMQRKINFSEALDAFLFESFTGWATENAENDDSEEAVSPPLELKDRVNRVLEKANEFLSCEGEDDKNYGRFFVDVLDKKGLKSGVAMSVEWASEILMALVSAVNGIYGELLELKEDRSKQGFTVDLEKPHNVRDFITAYANALQPEQELIIELPTDNSRFLYMYKSKEGRVFIETTQYQHQGQVKRNNWLAYDKQNR